MRKFLLVRHRDLTGVSGTGVVAEGIEFSDGSAALRWQGDQPATTVWEKGVRSILAVHGHNGASTIERTESPQPNQPDQPCGDVWGLHDDPQVGR